MALTGELYSLFPYGFIQSKRMEIVDGEGDKDIDELFRNYLSKPDSFKLKEVRLKAIDYFLMITQQSRECIENYFTMMINSGNLNKDAIEFLHDTYRFIKTGRRRIDVRLWVAILHDSMEFKTQAIAPEALPNLAVFKEADEPYLTLADWIAKPYGMDDLIWTLRIMFGSKDIA